MLASCRCQIEHSSDQSNAGDLRYKNFTSSLLGSRLTRTRTSSYILVAVFNSASMSSPNPVAHPTTPVPDAPLDTDSTSHTVISEVDRSKDVEKANADVSTEPVPEPASGCTRIASRFIHYASHPVTRRVICVLLLFAASELYPFLGSSIHHRPGIFGQARDVTAAAAIGASIVAGLYLLAAVAVRFAAPACVANQPRLVMLAVETAVCLVVGCFVPSLGVAVRGGELDWTRNTDGEHTLGVEVLVASVIGMFVTILVPIVLLPLAGVAVALATSEGKSADG